MIKTVAATGVNTTRATSQIGHLGGRNLFSEAKGFHVR